MEAWLSPALTLSIAGAACKAPGRLLAIVTDAASLFGDGGSDELGEFLR
jgi:hypothetical protein